jgi:hypothetical protein
LLPSAQDETDALQPLASDHNSDFQASDVAQEVASNLSPAPSQPFAKYYNTNFQGAHVVQNITGSLFPLQPELLSHRSADVGEVLRPFGQYYVKHFVGSNIIEGIARKLFRQPVPPKGSPQVELRRGLSARRSVATTAPWFNRYYGQHFRGNANVETYARRLFPGNFPADRTQLSSCSSVPIEKAKGLMVDAAATGSLLDAMHGVADSNLNEKAKTALASIAESGSFIHVMERAVDSDLRAKARGILVDSTNNGSLRRALEE